MKLGPLAALMIINIAVYASHIPGSSLAARNGPTPPGVPIAPPGVPIDKPNGDSHDHGEDDHSHDHEEEDHSHDHDDSEGHTDDDDEGEGENEDNDDSEEHTDEHDEQEDGNNEDPDETLTDPDAGDSETMTSPLGSSKAMVPWQALVPLNPHINPDFVPAGAVVRVPPGTFWIARRGETIRTVAKHFVKCISTYYNPYTPKSTLDPYLLAQMNHVLSIDAFLPPGSLIRLPPDAGYLAFKRTKFAFIAKYLSFGGHYNIY